MKYFALRLSLSLDVYRDAPGKPQAKSLTHDATPAN